jgi:hypothetical protein
MLIALVALAALTGFTFTEAAARGHHGGGGGRSFGHSVGHSGFASRGIGRGAFGGGSFIQHRGIGHRGFVRHRHGLYPFAYYGGYNSCYRWRYVPTRHGLRLRRVWVCGWRYY